jgi:hypothetical protein
MQSKHFNARFAAILVVSSLPLFAYAQNQSKYENDTFTVMSRSDHGSVRIHLQGKGDHCWAAGSEDRTVGISMGDDMCTASEYGVPDEVGVVARVMPNKISFRLNGKSYSISDPATVKTARGLFDPLVSIEAQQSDLSAQQRALGQKQRDLGHQQTEVKVRVPDMSAEFQKVEADVKRLSSQGGTASDVGDLESELGDLQSRIGDLQSQAGDAESKLGDQQSVLGDQQSRLGDQQSELGEKAEKLAPNIAEKLQGMLTQAIHSGAAKPE